MSFVGDATFIEAKAHKSKLEAKKFTAQKLAPTFFDSNVDINMAVFGKPLLRWLGIVKRKKKTTSRVIANSDLKTSPSRVEKPKARTVYQWKAECWVVPVSVAVYTLSFLDLNEVVRLKTVSKKFRDYSEKAIEFNFQPRISFGGKWSLQDAVKKYCESKKNYNEIATTYGYPINKWDVSKIKDFSGLFKQQKQFNEYIGDWNVSNAKCMQEMFWGATSFNQPLDSWDTSKVENMSRMFAGAHAFDQSIKNWDTSKVQNIEDMFHNARSFNQPLGTWNTSKVKYCKGAFEGAISFCQDLSSWDISEIQDWDQRYLVVEWNAALWHILHQNVQLIVRDVVPTVQRTHQQILEETFKQELDKHRKSHFENRWHGVDIATN